MQKCIKTYESGNDRSSRLKKNQVSLRSLQGKQITYRQQAPYEVVSDVYKMFFCLVTGIFLGRVFFVENDRCFLGKTGSLIKVVGELLVPIPLYQRAFSSPEPVFVLGTRMINARNSWRP